MFESLFGKVASIASVASVKTKARPTKPAKPKSPPVEKFLRGRAGLAMLRPDVEIDDVIAISGTKHTLTPTDALHWVSINDDMIEGQVTTIRRARIAMLTADGRIKLVEMPGEQAAPIDATKAADDMVTAQTMLDCPTLYNPDVRHRFVSRCGKPENMLRQAPRLPRAYVRVQGELLAELCGDDGGIELFASSVIDCPRRRHMAIDALRQPEYTHALPEWSPDPLAVVTVANLWKSDSGIWQATLARADGSVYLRYVRNWNRDHCPEGKDSPAVGQPLSVRDGDSLRPLGCLLPDVLRPYRAAPKKSDKLQPDLISLVQSLGETFDGPRFKADDVVDYESLLAAVKTVDAAKDVLGGMVLNRILMPPVEGGDLITAYIPYWAWDSALIPATPADIFWLLPDDLFVDKGYAAFLPINEVNWADNTVPGVGDWISQIL